MIVVDTGPNVAFLNQDDSYHTSAVKQFSDLPTPFLTCEGTLVEAAHLNKRKSAKKDLLNLISFEALLVSFPFQEETDNIKKLIEQYKDAPMDWEICLFSGC